MANPQVRPARGERRRRDRRERSTETAYIYRETSDSISLSHTQGGRWHAPSSRHLRAVLSVCGRCSVGHLGCCSCRVRVCRCRCRGSCCVCDLLIFLHPQVRPACGERRRRDRRPSLRTLTRQAGCRRANSLARAADTAGGPRRFAWRRRANGYRGGVCEERAAVARWGVES